MAIETISETLATMVARLTVAWPGAPRSWSSASAAGTHRGVGVCASRTIAQARHQQQRAEEQQARWPGSRTAAIPQPVAATRRARRRPSSTIPGRTRRSGRNARLFVAGLERRRGRGARGFERGDEAAEYGDRNAERAEDRRARTVRRRPSAPRHGRSRRQDRRRRRASRRQRAHILRTIRRSDPAAPTVAPSTSSNATRRRRESMPSVRSSANCARRRTTDSACVENTSRPPVNSATSASTLRLTR